MSQHKRLCSVTISYGLPKFLGGYPSRTSKIPEGGHESRQGGGKTGIAPLEFGSKKQKFLENLKSAA